MRDAQPFSRQTAMTTPGGGRLHLSERAKRWAATMSGFDRADLAVRHAHVDSTASIRAVPPLLREEREERERRDLAPGATLATGAGSRALDEEPDPLRTCFERDRDRILHSSAFRRLAGKTQVFVFPDDHQRTRLTHALEVAQVATSIAKALSLNVALTEAIALGHDCGHGPGGHASEDALTPFLQGGFDHAVFGADVILEPLNLTTEVLDGVRNHSWSRPAPSTPEGEVVSWADRIAYVCHDFEDARRAGVIDARALPDLVRARVGTAHSEQLGTFIEALVASSISSNTIGMDPETATALAEFRAFNYESIYLRADSVAQANAVIAVLSRLVRQLMEGGYAALDAVAYVAGMTDRFAFRLAVERFSYPVELLPQGIDTSLRGY